MCLAVARGTPATAEASPAEEYRLRLKVAGAPTLSPNLGGPVYLNPQPVSLELAALAPSGLLPRRSASASLSARKICPAYFFDRNRTSKKLRQLPKPRLSAAAHYNQLTKSTNMSIALKAVPGTVAISDDEMRRFCSQCFRFPTNRRRFGEVQFSSYLLHSQRDARKRLGSRTRTRAEHSK